MVVVDTNIVFALLVESDRSAEARELHARDADWRTESQAMIELSNVLVRYVRARMLSANKAIAVMSAAEARLASGLVRCPHADAFRIAMSRSVSAYDARFLVVAAALGVPLVTEDAKLRRAAPQLTQSLQQALGR